MSRKAIPLLWSLLLVVLIFVLVKTIPYYLGLFAFARMSQLSVMASFIGLVSGLLLGAERVALQEASGRWRFNINRVVVAGVPLLVIGMLAILRLVAVSPWFSHVSLFASIGVGYVMISSLAREPEKQKKILSWFIWSAVLALVLYGMFRLNAHLTVTSPRVLSEEIAALIFGILLGLERVLFSQPIGGWRFNYIRLLLAGIPLMLVLLYTLEVLPVTQTWLANNLEVSLIKRLVSVALGYVLVTSLERKQLPK